MEIDYKKYRAAYFSMEIAADPEMKNYAGGLGVLAGDLLRAAADASLPIVGVTLLHDLGYLEQIIDAQGRQQEGLVDFNLDKLEKLPMKVPVEIGSENIKVAVWRYLLRGLSGHIVPVFFLDTNLEENPFASREITRRLYRGDAARRLEQEIVLGRGGARLLEALGCSGLRKFYLNEGHASLAAIELFLKSQATDDNSRLEEVRQKCLFTTHTPLKEANDVFAKKLVLEYQPDFPWHLSGLLDGAGRLNMARAGLYFSSSANAVSQRHQEVMADIFPEFQIGCVTNGVHVPSWVSPEMAEVFDAHLPAWRQNNQRLEKAESLPTETVWAAHQSAKKKLIEYAFSAAGRKLDQDRLTIVLARRFALYKRPELILSDLGRLKRISAAGGGLQIIFSGKAHPQDKAGMERLRQIWLTASASDEKLPIVFLSGYGIEIARQLVAGADLWLNTPLAPFEACGTSGMKAALNGVPQLSIADGWWAEGGRHGQNGWVIEDRSGLDPDRAGLLDADDIYRLLETEIMPLYYRQRPIWQKMMVRAIALGGFRFSAQRAMEEYWQRAKL